jgi:hypothetical protein
MERNAMKKLGLIFIIISLFIGCYSEPEPQPLPPPELPPPPPPPPPQEKTPFTVSMREALQDDQLSQIQFYLSGSITLIKEDYQGDTGVQSGKVITTSGQNLEEVYLPTETQGIFVSNDEHGILNISFENDTIISFFPNKNKDRYELMLNIKDGHMVVNYGHTDYAVSLFQSELPYLLVIREEKTDDFVDRRTVKGRSVY